MASIERCRREIAAIEELIRDGHSDVQGLCLALSDWCAELRLLEKNAELERKKARRGGSRAGGRGRGECYLLIE